MQEKIKFLEEILSFDQSSKLFYPLAELYARQKEYNRACTVLERGLRSHGDHLEARMLYALMLAQLEDREKLHSQMREIEGRLKKFSGFFALWSESFYQDGAQDSAIFSKLFADVLSGRPVDIAGIFLRGLKIGHQAASSFSLQVGGEVFRSEYSMPEKDEDAEEGSLEDLKDKAPTKTMADLMALHGEYLQAHAIYEKLWQKADGGEKEYLAGQMQKMQDALQEKQPETDGPSQILDTLKNLASRLEERAHANEK